MPYDAKIAIIGNGQVAKGVMRILHGLGAKQLDVYDYFREDLFRKVMFDYDIIVNCVFWDTSRADRLIYREDLKKFRKGTLIVDISCDPELEIETSHPTTIDDPVYTVDGVVHYAVDNTPAMFNKCPLNGILIGTWRGDPNDSELQHLACYLDWLSNQKSMQRNHQAWRIETLCKRSY